MSLSLTGSPIFTFVHVNTDAGSHVSEISDVAETTTQVTPNWFNLSNTEKYQVHESKDIEGHLLGREHANSMHFNPLSNQFHIGLVHDSGATSPPKGGPPARIPRACPTPLIPPTLPP